MVSTTLLKRRLGPGGGGGRVRQGQGWPRAPPSGAAALGLCWQLTGQERERDGVDAVLLLRRPALGVGDVHLELDRLLEHGRAPRRLVLSPEARLGDDAVAEAGDLRAAGGVSAAASGVARGSPGGKGAGRPPRPQQHRLPKSLSQMELRVDRRRIATWQQKAGL